MSPLQPDMPVIIPPLHLLQHHNQNFRAAVFRRIQEQEIPAHFVHLPELTQRFGHVMRLLQRRRCCGRASGRPFGGWFQTALVFQQCETAQHKNDSENQEQREC